MEYVITWRDTSDWHFSANVDGMVDAIHLQSVLKDSAHVKPETIKRERVEK